MDELGTNRRSFMGGIAAGTIGLGLDGDSIWGQMDPISEPPQTGDPPDGMFLDISGIEGGSLDVEHEAEIEILSWQFGMERSLDPKSRKGSGAPAFDSLVVVKLVDKASPQMMTSFATGDLLSRATLAVRREPSQGDWLTIDLNEVQITNVTDFGPGNSLPLEQITLNYGKISVTVKEINPDGTLGNSWDFEWTIA